MVIKRQPKSGIINPPPGKKKEKKLVSAFWVSFVFQALFCCFTEHAGAARFLTALLILSAAGLSADSVATIVYPTSFPPSLPSSFFPFLLSFLLLFLQYGGRQPEKYCHQHIKKVILATSSAPSDSVKNCFIKPNFFQCGGISFYV